MSNPAYSEYAEQCLENIFNTLDQIRCGQIHILTGENGSGKSLIVKTLHHHLNNIEDDEVKVATWGMNKRAGIDTGTGIRAFTADIDWTCTSENSLGMIKNILKQTNRFIVIDEPEVGMGETLQASLGNWLSKQLPEVIKQNKGVLIITHSKHLVRNINCEHVFLNMQGKDKETWLNEIPSVIDLDEFEARNLALFNLLRDHLR